MSAAPTSPSSPSPNARPNGFKLRRVLESNKPRKQSFADYRRFIQGHYDGFAGKMTGVTGVLTGHEALAGRLIRKYVFDVRGCKTILDAGSGDGRHMRFLLRYADKDATLTAFDLSQRMLQRSRQRLRSSRVSLVAADVTRLPFADGSFDAVICGWMLEHLPGPKPGLLELARVMRPGGKMLLMVTEDTIVGSMCSAVWHCRTYNRSELQRVCGECGLQWARPLWFTGLHQMFRLGGIVVELHRS